MTQKLQNDKKLHIDTKVTKWYNFAQWYKNYIGIQKLQNDTRLQIDYTKNTKWYKIYKLVQKLHHYTKMT